MPRKSFPKDPQVAELVENDGIAFTFHRTASPTNEIRMYETFVMGRFVCPNRMCATRGWSSRKIAIVIRLYADARYNARVYRQRCKECEHLGRLELDEQSYAERVAYRLKKWSGIEVDAPVYREDGNSRPHRSELCEGCKDGHCSGNQWLL